MENFSLYELLNHFSFYVRKAASELMPKNWVLPIRTLFDHELLFVEQGKINCVIEDVHYIINPNEILLIPPGKIHSFTTEGDCLLQTHMHFDFFFNSTSLKRIVSFGIIRADSHQLSPNGDLSMVQKNIYDALHLPYKIVLSNINAQTIKELIYKIIDLQISQNMISILEIKRYMLEIFEIIFSEYLVKFNNQTQERDIFRIINILIERQFDKKFNLNEIANKVGYSKNYLSQIYKDKFGMTPAQYHTKTQIRKAKSYLLQENSSVTEISDSMGFLTVSDFSRWFKNIVGVCPQDYKKRKLNSAITKEESNEKN